MIHSVLLKNEFTVLSTFTLLKESVFCISMYGNLTELGIICVANDTLMFGTTVN